ncbi:MAG: phosphatase [Oscillospiraceae bacterium]|nr:phosphatase [Oscillospiraceae bacterium]MCR4761247.1 phosphatase [Oscillospiraceae bacterium]
MLNKLRIRADLHTHTVASTHAYSTVSEMAAAAAQTGLQLLGITDHGPGSPDSPHVWHFHNYKILPRIINGVYLLKGVEANIMDEFGTLDMDEYELSFCEWVIASYHTACVHFERTPELISQGYRKVCENPLVDVIGHPTTAMFPFDYEPVLKLFKEAGKLVEINESSLQWKQGALENAKTVYALCKKHEIPIILNTDAHFAGQVGKTPVAIRLLQDLDFPARLIVNLDAGRIMDMAEKKRGISFSTLQQSPFGIENE